MYIHIYIERHTKQPRKWMRKRKEGAKEREMESSRGNGRWNGEEKGRECGEGGRVRERERERERKRRRTWVCYRDGQGAANVYNINANGLPYTLYTIPTLHQPSLPLFLFLPIPLHVSRHPSRHSPKYRIIFMDVFELMLRGVPREKGGERWLVSDRETTRRKGVTFEWVWK